MRRQDRRLDAADWLAKYARPTPRRPWTPTSTADVVWVPCRVLDVSPDGAGLVVDADFRVGDRIVIELAPPENPKHVVVLAGEIRDTTEHASGGRRVGIRFSPAARRDTAFFARTYEAARAAQQPTASGPPGDD